jgi:Ca2+-binding RTX toxin-like protein
VINDGVANDGVAGEGDNVRGMEILTGTAFADHPVRLEFAEHRAALRAGRQRHPHRGRGGPDAPRRGRQRVLDAGGGADDLFGGPGDDTLFGGAGDDEIEAAAGNDTASGGRGADRFDSLFDGDGADAWSGGAGADSITYAGAGGPVTITADGAADDGAPAEGDNVGADIEVIVGTIDDDAITGGAVEPPASRAPSTASWRYGAGARTSVRSARRRSRSGRIGPKHLVCSTFTLPCATWCPPVARTCT